MVLVWMIFAIVAWEIGGALRRRYLPDRDDHYEKYWLERLDRAREHMRRTGDTSGEQISGPDLAQLHKTLKSLISRR